MRSIRNLLLFASFLCFSFKGSVQSLVGTKWRLEYTAPGGKHMSFYISFNSNGRLHNEHPNDETPDNDKWSQQGRKVTMSFNDGFAIYKGKIIGKNEISGTATNNKKEKWSWNAYRMIDGEMSGTSFNE